MPGAAWTRISFFAQYFARKGETVAVAGTFSPKTLSKRGIRKWNGLTLFNITPMLMMTNILSLVFNGISSFFSSLVLIAYLRPAKVIISIPNGDGAFGCYLAAKIFRKSIVIDYRDEWEDFIIRKTTSEIYKRSYSFLKTLMTRCYVNSDHVLTVTEPLANTLLVRGIKNVKVLTNGADTNVFKSYDKMQSRDENGLNQSDFIILYSGGIGAYYKLDIVVKSIGKLIDKLKNVRLVLVGDGPDLANVLNVAKEIDVQDRVIYLGSKSDKTDLAKIISAADVGIIPYDANPLWKNSLPAKAFEYFACGIPVVATVYRDSILGKLILENKVGLTTDPENVNALSDCFEKIFSDDYFRNNSGKIAISLIRERFDRNKIAEEFFDLIKC